MIFKAKELIKLNSMIEKGDRIVIGVSGGADSVCLLHVLNELSKEEDVQLFAVHVNHGIRGLEAKADEDFVKQFCDKLGIPLRIFEYDVKGIAKAEGLSEEEAGRKVRYQAFLNECESNQCNKIAVAHNKNDNAETVLFHLFRGSGITGLTGIVSSRDIKAGLSKVTLIRPLLCVSRKEIETYLFERGITYQTDATNLTDDYSRNKIRNQVLTYVTKEINQKAIEHVTQAATQLKEIQEFINRMASAKFSELVEEENNVLRVDIYKLKQEDFVIQKELVRRILAKLGGSLKDIEAKHIQQVLDLLEKQVGKQINMPYRIIAMREYDKVKFYINNIFINKCNCKTVPVTIDLPGRYPIAMHGKMLEIEVFENEKNMIYPKNKYTKWFDYGKIENTVEIRTRQEGDYIQINCSGGRKKLKDYFIDLKIPKEERSNILLVADGNHIMWILDDRDRMSEKYKVVKSTKKILSMSLLNVED